jgi:methyltransferase-like protein 23
VIASVHIANLPLTETALVIAGRTYWLLAARNQDALLAATADREQVPFGLMVWESAVVLADALAARAATLARKCVLELGAGVGLAGIVAAAYGAQVDQTDYDELAVHVSRHNADRNGVGTLASQAVADWRSWQPAQQYDLIIGADIVYDRDDHQAVVRLLGLALKPDGEVLLSDPNRQHTQSFIAQLKHAGWSVATTTGDTPDLTVPARTVRTLLIRAHRGYQTT